MGTKATKSDLIAAIALRHDMSKAEATRVVDTALGFIADVVASGRPVTLSGFGTFTTRHRKARTGRNPATGAPVAIAEATVMGFRARRTKGGA
jgi:nucleoid DNA-binding protein